MRALFLCPRFFKTLQSFFSILRSPSMSVKCLSCFSSSKPLLFFVFKTLRCFFFTHFCVENGVLFLFTQILFFPALSLSPEILFFFLSLTSMLKIPVVFVS